MSQTTPPAPPAAPAPPAPDATQASPGGTRTAAGGTYGDFRPQAPKGMRDPSRGAEMERNVMPQNADFSRPPAVPEPAAPPKPPEDERADGPPSASPPR